MFEASKSCVADEETTVPPYTPTIAISSCSTITTACSKPIPTENMTSGPTSQTPSIVTGDHVTPNVHCNL